MNNIFATIDSLTLVAQLVCWALYLGPVFLVIWCGAVREEKYQGQFVFPWTYFLVAVPGVGIVIAVLAAIATYASPSRPRAAQL